MPTLNDAAFENMVGKEENADNQDFLLFPRYFQFCHGQILSSEPPLNLLSVNDLNLDKSKILLKG